MRSGKIWGSTQEILRAANLFEFHRIAVKQGGFCSKHKHERKVNAFYVERGVLEITVWKKDYDLVDKTVLTGGDVMMVMPGEYHKFEALEDTIAFEVYWVNLDPNDIQREDCGGTA